MHMNGPDFTYPIEGILQRFKMQSSEKAFCLQRKQSTLPRFLQLRLLCEIVKEDPMINKPY